MNRRIALRLSLICLALSLLVGCSRDPNVRKQKYFESGKRYAAQGKYQEAAIQFLNAIQIDPRFSQAHYELAQTYLKLADGGHASQELVRTVELDPANYHARTDLVNLLVSVRNADGSTRKELLDQATTYLDALRKDQPDAPETHQALSNYYAATGDIKTALHEMETTISLDPNRADSYVMRGLLDLRSNQPDQAEVSFKKAIAVDPKETSAILALAGFYQSRNRLPEAEQQIQHAIDLDPKDPGLRAALVRVYRSENKNSEVEELLQRTKKDFPDNSEGYRMLGDFYYANGDIDKATAEYGSLNHDHPKDALVKRNYIQLLILKNRFDEATKLNNEVLKGSPNDVNALIHKGEILLRQNDATGAVEALQKALRNDPDNAIGHYQLGVAFDQQRLTSRAEAEWRDAVRLRPDLTDAQRALGAVELMRGNSNGLLEVSQQIIKFQPNAADGYLMKCVAEIGLQKIGDAQKDAEQAAQKAPQSPAPYVQLGNVQLILKHYPEAEQYYRQSLEKDPSYSDGLSGLMNTFIAAKQFEKAIAAAQVQVAKVPNSSNFHDLLGTALFNGRKDLPGAEAELKKAVELDKNNTDALEKLGKVQVQSGASDQALALYQQSIKDNPREPRFYILAGEIYESKQNWDQAKAMYQQALNVQPDQPLASNNLAYVMLQQGGNVDVALAMAQTARRGMPNSPNAADTLGWAYYHKGIYESAISQFQEALRLSERGGAPDDAMIHYHLGLAYQKANQNALARQHLEKAVKLSPNNADARKALSELRG